MKKLLAIVLSLAMVLSLATVAFAAEVAPGQVYVGPVEDVHANPGEEVLMDIELIGSALENDGYPRDSKLVIPFEIFSSSDAPITDLVLTDEAVAAGVELVYDEAMGDVKEESMYQGSFVLSSNYLYDSQITLATLILQVPEEFEWPEVGEGEPAPSIGINFAIGADFYLPIYVETEEGETMDVVSITADAVITERPYEPTFWENIVETIKSYLSTFIDILVIGLNYVKNEFLKKADWFTPPDIVIPPFISDIIG